MIDLNNLREILDYNPDTGIFTWKARLSIRVTVGSKAGTYCKNGYMQTSLFNKRVYLHRLAWFYYYGEWPNGQVDHINHIRDDNRISNLRIVKDYVENGHNAKKKSNNSSGVTGVVWDSERSMWKAQLFCKGKHVLNKRFSTFDEACKARKCAEKEFGFHENHGKDIK